MTKENFYQSLRIVDGKGSKSRYVIVDKSGNIVNKSQPDIMKSIANRRIGNQNQNHSNTKGDKSQELACLEFGWKDLNKENNNYCFPIDCLDPKTESFHQVKGRWYDHIEMRWNFGNLEREWIKKISFWSDNRKNGYFDS